MVYYDDLFAEEFGSKAVTRVEAIMAVVDEMYDEDDTFKTKLDVETVAIKHATGQNWGTSTNWGSDVLCRGCPTDTIATSSETEANLYVFLTGNGAKDGLGLAYLGSVCDTTRRRRTSINKYAAGSQKGGDAYTAETVAHEMGHNLGLAHDCLNGNCAYWSSSYKGRLYFCATFVWFFRPGVPFGDLLFIHASTNATDDHNIPRFLHRF